MSFDNSCGLKWPYRQSPKRKDVFFFQQQVGFGIQTRGFLQQALDPTSLSSHWHSIGMLPSISAVGYHGGIFGRSS